MTKFMTKPYEVDAMQYMGSESVEKINEWLGTFAKEFNAEEDDNGEELYCHLDEELLAEIADWIVYECDSFGILSDEAFRQMTGDSKTQEKDAIEPSQEISITHPWFANIMFDLDMCIRRGIDLANDDNKVTIPLKLTIKKDMFSPEIMVEHTVSLNIANKPINSKGKVNNFMVKRDENGHMLLVDPQLSIEEIHKDGEKQPEYATEAKGEWVGGPGDVLKEFPLEELMGENDDTNT